MPFDAPVRVRDFAPRPSQRSLLSSEPRTRPSALNARKELARQFQQLHKRRGQNPVDAALFNERRQEVERRFGRLALRSAAAPRPADSIAHSSFSRGMQRFLTGLTHPATSWLPPRRVAIGQHQRFVADGIAEGWAERCTFWASDEGAALLDGLLIAKQNVRERHNKPHIMVVVGFAMTYEAVIPQAKSFADDFDCVVVLHNSRGVGRSLGTQRSLCQAIEDCKGVIRSLKHDGHRHIGAYGISMGSATLFYAVSHLTASGELEAGDIGLLASVRGVSSIPNVVGALLGSFSARAAQSILRRANLPDMDVPRVLHRPLSAREILITTAANDRLVRGRGQLAEMLGAQNNGMLMLKNGQEAQCIFEHGSGHVDPNIRTAVHDGVIERWAGQSRPSAVAPARHK